MHFLRASLVSAIGALVLLAAPASAQSSPAIGAAAPDTATLRAIEGQVSQIRGLQALTEPDLQLLDHASLNTYLASQFERDYLPNEREADQKEFVLLGLIKPTDNLVQIQLNLLSDQVVGVYDSEAKSLFVVADQAGFGPSERMTYAHEFNHALQDQYYDLNKIAPKHPASNDRSLAVHALIEGDAIMLQTLWAQSNLSQDDLIQLARVTAGSDDILARAPLVVRTELLFPYIDGFNFVRQAYRQAGNDYAVLDDLFKNPPASSASSIRASFSSSGAPATATPFTLPQDGAATTGSSSKKTAARPSSSDRRGKRRTPRSPSSASTRADSGHVSTRQW